MAKTRAQRFSRASVLRFVNGSSDWSASRCRTIRPTGRHLGDHPEARRHEIDAPAVAAEGGARRRCAVWSERRDAPSGARPPHALMYAFISDPSGRTVARRRGRRNSDAGMGRVVQSRALAGTAGVCSAAGVGDAVCHHAQHPHARGCTHLNPSPEFPERFSIPTTEFHRTCC